MEIRIYNVNNSRSNWHKEILLFLISLKTKQYPLSINQDKCTLSISTHNYDIDDSIIQFLIQNNYDFIFFNYNREIFDVIELNIYHSKTNAILVAPIYCGTVNEQLINYRWYATLLRFVDIILKQPDLLIKEFFNSKTIVNAPMIEQNFKTISNQELLKSIIGYYDNELGCFHEFNEYPRINIKAIFELPINSVLIYKNTFINYNQFEITDNFDNRFYESLEFNQYLYTNFVNSPDFYLINNNDEFAFFENSSKILLYDNLKEYDSFIEPELFDLMKKSERDIIKILKFYEEEINGEYSGNYESSITIISNQDNSFFIENLVDTLKKNRIYYVIEQFSFENTNTNTSDFKSNIENASFYEICEQLLKKYLR